MFLVDAILGRPLASDEEKRERISTIGGVPTFGLDALSSAAYGPEAALTILMPLGAAGLAYALPIMGAIIVVLALVYLSYRQTIAAYPEGAGSYTVAHENLGPTAGLLAGAALMTDYILNVAVGISAGVGAIISAAPGLQPHTLSMCLAILVFLTLVNLRGVRTPGILFMSPTVVFVCFLFGVIAWGVYQSIVSGGHPRPERLHRLSCRWRLQDLSLGAKGNKGAAMKETRKHLSASTLRGGPSGPGRPAELQRRTFGDERDLFIAPGMTPEAAAQPAQLREGELSQMKIKGSFTLAVAGDIIGTYPIADLQEPAVQGVLSIIRSADVAFGNMEANVTDYATATGQVGGLTGPKQIAADVKAQGFDMVLRATNQSTTMGTDKMLESNRIIAEAALVYAGSGRNLQEARSPAYHMTPKGRVGMVGMYAYPALVHQAPYVTASLTDAAAGEAATYQTGFRGGLPGVNPMRLHQAILVPQEDLDVLRKIAVANNELAKQILAEAWPLSTARSPRLKVETDPSSPVQLFATTYALGERGRKRLTMYEDDERLNLRSIRDAKEAADFMIAAIHSHDSAWTIPFDFLQSEPTDFLIKLAHEAIDNEADAFVGSGVHVLRGIEIYKGRPIFYGLMSYNYQITTTPVAYDRYRDNGLNPFTTEYTETELNWKGWPPINVANHPDPTNMESMESVGGEARFQDGKLSEVRIYPIDFGSGLPMSQKGAPRLFTGKVAQRILTRMQRISEPLGTDIAIHGDIGIIRVGPDGRSLPEG